MSRWRSKELILVCFRSFRSGLVRKGNVGATRCAILASQPAALGTVSGRTSTARTKLRVLTETDGAALSISRVALQQYCSGCFLNQSPNARVPARLTRPMPERLRMIGVSLARAIHQSFQP
jgi:hypothetical protein